MSFRRKVYGAKPNRRCRAAKWCENTQNMSFEPKGVHQNLPSSMSRVLLFETFNQMHAYTSFCNRSGASMKWRETFENMSFGPKVVDWACSLL